MYTEYCDMIKTLVSTAKQEIAKGVFCPEVDGDGLGKVVDMIKDLESAKKDYYEACYYKEVVKAMKGYDDKEQWPEEEEERPMGYNHSRNAKGQFTSRPSSSMRVRGFHPDYRMMIPKLHEDLLNNPMTRNVMMGYPDDGSMMNSEHGRIYDEYSNAKRNYTETRSASDKTMAEKRGKEYFVNGLRNMLEIYQDADPVMKKELKENFMGVMEEMG